MIPIVEKRALVVALGDRTPDNEDSHTSVDTESSSDHEVCFLWCSIKWFLLLVK